VIKEWETVKTEDLGNYRVFQLQAVERISPRTGNKHRFFKIQSSDWVNIMPITADGRVVMVRQYRHGNSEITLEVPGGMVDEGEDPMISALRELREETGYEGVNPQKIGQVAPNPALFDNICHSYTVENVQKVGEQEFDSAEDIEIELVPLTEIPNMIASGAITHALTINAYYFYQQHLQQNINTEK